jgi:hypothetical protein
MFAATAAGASAKHEVATAEEDGEAEQPTFPCSSPGSQGGTGALTDRRPWRGSWSRSLAHNKGTAPRGGGEARPGRRLAGLQQRDRPRRDEIRAHDGQQAPTVCPGTGAGHDRGDPRWPLARPGTEDESSTKARWCEADAAGTTERRARTPVRSHRSRASAEHRWPRLEVIPTLPCPARGRQEGTSAATDHERSRGAGRRGAEKRHRAHGGGGTGGCR